MQRKSKLTICAALLLAAAMLLAGCAHSWRVSLGNNTPEPEATPSPEGTDEPVDSEVPTEEPADDTAEPTEEPNGTDIPVTGEPATDEPATEEPNETEAQKPTEAPKPTENQKPTEAPKSTNTPKPTEAPKPTQAPVSSDFKSFSAPSLNGGGDFSNATFSQNTLTIVNFWSTTCGPCIKEMPVLQRIANEYASKGVKVVTVLGDSETPGCIKSALDTFAGIGVTIPMIRCNASITDAFVRPFNIGAYPYTFFVDSNGHILQQVNKDNDYNGWASLVNGLLK